MRWNKLVLKIIQYIHRGGIKGCEHLCICVRGSLAHYSDDLEVSFVISLM